MRIIPAIDIIDGKCVRLSQGDYGRKKVYNENPVEVAKQFQDAGLRYLHLVDLDGAKAGKVVNWKIIENICNQTALQIDFGGGVKKEKDVKELLNLGVTQINIGSLAVKNPELVYSWISQFGSSSIILSADVKNEQVAIQGWQEDARIDINTLVENYTKYRLQFVTCTDISKDGMLEGSNVDLYKRLMHRFPNINIIASGGVGSMEDLYALQEVDVYGAIIGKAIYEGKIQLEELNALQ